MLLNNFIWNIFIHSDIGVPNAWEFRKDNEKYQMDFTAPGVEVHCLYGSNVTTVEKYVYNLYNRKKEIKNKFRLF